jgi:hypothetical protein
MLFVSEDLRLACEVRAHSLGTSRGGLTTSVWDRVSRDILLEDAPTEWTPPSRSDSAVANERLGQLRVELGVVGAGDLYCLYVVRRNQCPETLGDKTWVAAATDTARDDLRLLPQFSSSPYTPYDWVWQDGWWCPYSTFRPATQEELVSYAATRQANEA